MGQMSRTGDSARGDVVAQVLDKALLEFGAAGGPKDTWRLADAVEGTQIFGATGSGKTSGSGAALARAFLDPARGRMGGLVLSAKPDEIDNWRGYLHDVGRPASDLVELSPSQPACFNFLDYERREGERSTRGVTLTYNLVSLFLAALSSGEGAVSTADPYWNDALRELLTHTIDLAIFGADCIELADLASIVRSAPQSRADARLRSWQDRSRCFALLRAAEKRYHTLPPPRRQDLEQTLAYWMDDFPALNDRTRSVVVSSFTAKVAGLLRSPMRELLCTSTSAEVKPEASHQGKVIVANIPVKVFGEVGRFAQILYKTVWQRATERRDLSGTWTPVFLWADEAQYFATTDDMLFQQTARSKLAATVYLTQNLPNYYATFGGRNGQAVAESLLGNLQTKIFHANGDPSTNEWAERLFGQHMRSVHSRNFQGSEAGQAWNPTRMPNVESAYFTTLRKGGPWNDCEVGALIFQGGRRWRTNGDRNFLQHAFRQSPR